MASTNQVKSKHLTLGFKVISNLALINLTALTCFLEIYSLITPSHYPQSLFELFFLRILHGMCLTTLKPSFFSYLITLNDLSFSTLK